MANTLTFAGLTLTDANIFGGISFLADLNTGEEFSIGNTASTSVSFTTDTQLPIYTKDAVNGTFTWTQDNAPRGRYYITDVKKNAGKYDVTAYDAMILLDTGIDALSITFPASVSGLASAIATYLGCTVSGTIYNGTLTVDELDDGMQIRQLLGYIAEASGCSVKIDGSDHLCFMYYADSGITITASEYKENGLDIADYVCAPIDNVKIFDIAGMVCAEAGSGTNSLFIQGNPFLYEATDTEAAVILGLVDSFAYAPLTCEMFDEEGLEVGKTATFGTAPTLVMHLESSENGAVVSSVGSDSRAEYNKSVDIIANEAKNIATKLNQHFWYVASGDEAGAHIAEIDKVSFDADPTGSNLLATSNGVTIRDGMTKLASFGKSIKAGYGGADYLKIQAEGSMTETLMDWGTYTSDSPADTGTNTKSVDLNLATVSPFSSYWSSLSSGDKFYVSGVGEVSYLDGNSRETFIRRIAYDFTKGTFDYREWSSSYGLMQLQYDGTNTVKVLFQASASSTYLTSGTIEVNGYEEQPSPSFLMGTSVEAYDNALAIGKFNNATDQLAFMVGNGTAAGDRSNAFAVDWNGYIYPQDTKMVDFVTEEGAESGWYWRKWKSGKVEAWGTTSASATTGSSWGSLYYSDQSFAIPSGIFSSDPIRGYVSSRNNQWWAVGISSMSASSVSFRMAKPTSSSQAISVCIYLLYL